MKKKIEIYEKLLKLLPGMYILHFMQNLLDIQWHLGKVVYHIDPKDYFSRPTTYRVIKWLAECHHLIGPESQDWRIRVIEKEWLSHSIIIQRAGIKSKPNVKQQDKDQRICLSIKITLKHRIFRILVLAVVALYFKALYHTLFGQGSLYWGLNNLNERLVNNVYSIRH